MSAKRTIPLSIVLVIACAGKDARPSQSVERRASITLPEALRCPGELPKTCAKRVRSYPTLLSKLGGACVEEGWEPPAELLPEDTSGAGGEVRLWESKPTCGPNMTAGALKAELCIARLSARKLTRRSRRVLRHRPRALQGERRPLSGSSDSTRCAGRVAIFRGLSHQRRIL